jgi:large subunit ribosomal protein L4
MELKMIDANGQSASTVAASDALFARDYNEPLIHQVVTAYQANARQGTRAQKGRTDIAKSTRKPWRQKGTGRARAGMASSPLWRGGGRIFPSSPDENFTQKLNKKMYRAGVASILSQLAREDRLKVVESFIVEAPKTKLFLQKVKDMGVAGSLLLITDELDDNLVLSSRNLPNVLVLEVAETDPVSLIRYQNVILTRKAVSKFEEMLG